MSQISDQLAQIVHQLETSAAVQADIIARLTTVEAMTKKTVGVVEAWDTMKSGGKFLKWFAGVIVSFAAIWAALKVGVLGYLPPRH